MSEEARSAGTPPMMGGFDEPRGIALLWFGMLAGPAAWALDLVVKYSLVRYVCASGAGWSLYLTSIGTVGLAAAGVFVAYRSWRQAGSPAETTGSGTLGRTRFMALVGIALGSFFLYINILTIFPPLVLTPCSGGV